MFSLIHRVQGGHLYASTLDTIPTKGIAVILVFIYRCKTMDFKYLKNIKNTKRSIAREKKISQT